MRQANRQLRLALGLAVILAGCTNRAGEPVVNSADQRAAEQSAAASPKAKAFDRVRFPELDAFQPNRFDTTGELFCYTSPIRFRDSDAELAIYPNPDGTAISAVQAAALRQRFDQFQDAVDAALTALPEKARQLCDDYEIDIRKVPDADIIGNIRWHNVKLDPDGRIECYTSNPLVSDNFDIVLGFSSDMRLAYVHFDG